MIKPSGALRTGKKFSKPAMSRVINGDTELTEAPVAPEKIRLDHLLTDQYPSYNRSTLQKFIKQGFVTIDGEVATKPNQSVLPSAKIKLNLPPEDRELPRIPVIYEDDNVLVLNKPAGLLSMAKGEYCPEPTLEDYGLLVHRLDRDTSGVVILAKNLEAQKMLRRQFQDRKAHKTYYAIVEGHPKEPEALIDLPIERNFKRPNTFLITPNGKASQTHYKVMKQNASYSLLELKPTTGRTHQLRVHLQYLGTPILGDRVYGSADATKAPRLYLHAYQLEITIPEGQRRTFTAPLPPEFKDVL
ncbi:RluA family pseudouridine synthase [Candidatus Saccharibacteria bacterium]|nr:RluA family pseudouridine synthase [Candidatus Saccharibacteria bacterium]